eukprot:Skav222463  [mRNA]  locus=scaffold5414:30010:47306:- [translate_table: standard]
MAAPWLILVVLLCHWLSSDGIYSPLQVLVASPILRTARVPQGFQELKACAPKPLEADQLKALIAEAREPKRKPWRKGQPRRSSDKPGLWRCSACEQWLPEMAFYANNRCERRGPQAHCKQCNKENNLSHYNTLRGSLLRLAASARRRAKEKPWNSTVTLENLLEMVERQRGKCAYSCVPMGICLAHSHWRMSLERLNNSEGYSPENCVLVAGEFNTGDSSRQKGVKAETVKGSAQWSPVKVEAVFHLRRQPVNLEMLEKEINDAETRPKSIAKTSQAVQPRQAVKEEANCICCYSCGMFLSPANFTPSRRARGRSSCCRSCKRKEDRARRSTLRGHVQNCLNNARTRSKKRSQAFTLTFSQVLNMLRQQQGRCYYSGVPLEYKQIHSDWRLSIERLNNSIGYTNENCVLIAIEFNTPDYSRNKAATEVFGTAQWSREKAKDAVSYFQTTWQDFAEGAEVEEQALLPTTAEGRWLFQAGDGRMGFARSRAPSLTLLGTPLATDHIPRINLPIWVVPHCRPAVSREAQRADPTPEVWFVLNGTQATDAAALKGQAVPLHAGLWGLARCLRLEVPNAVCGCVDLGSDLPKDPPAAELVKRLHSLKTRRSGKDGVEAGTNLVGREVEPELLVSKGLMVSRLEETSAKFQEVDLESYSCSGRESLEPGSYGITGGTAGLGLLFAAFFAEKGATHLGLISRSGKVAQELRVGYGMAGWVVLGLGWGAWTDSDPASLATYERLTQTKAQVLLKGCDSAVPEAGSTGDGAQGGAPARVGWRVVMFDYPTVADLTDFIVAQFSEGDDEAEGALGGGTG